MGYFQTLQRDAVDYTASHLLPAKIRSLDFKPRMSYEPHI